MNEKMLYKSRDFLNEKYAVEGLSMREIGELCSIDRMTVKYWLTKHNLPIKLQNEWAKYYVHPKHGKGVGKKAIDRKSYLKHREKRLIEMKKYRQEHREEGMAKSKEYYYQNRERILAQNKKSAQKLRLEVLLHYGGDPPKCSCCDEPHVEFLSIDHINGDGTKHRREIGVGGGGSFYYWLKRNNYPEGFRVLCHNCNASFGLYGHCPHEKEV